MAVEITKKPDQAVYGLCAPVRYTVSGNTRLMKASWKFSNWQTSENNKARAQTVTAEWTLITSEKKNNRHTKVVELGNTSHTESSVNLNSFKAGKTTYTRASFYPNTKRMLKRVSVNVITHNSKGKSSVFSNGTREFKAPRKPVIGTPSFNADNGTVSATITTNAGTDYLERYDTRYIVEVYDSRTRKKVNRTDTSTTSTSVTASFDVANYQSLKYGDYVRVKFIAWARGYAGDSKKVTRTFYVSYPAQPTIRGIDVSGKTSKDKVTVYIKTGSTTTHPIDRVTLEYLPNVEYKTSSAIPGDAMWTTSDIMDDAQCTALTIPVAEVMPSEGKRTWIRIRSYHAAENVLYRYSNFNFIRKLETPAATATDERVKILTATAGEDGKSIVLELGWNENGQDDATGTELSWAEDSDAWKSTDDPDTYKFTWSDGPKTVGQITYNDSATITIKNLDEATKYYIKARRYLEGETTSYSPYSNTATCITSEKPETIVASCDGYVSAGEPLQVYWTFSGNGIQKKWQIISSDVAYGYRMIEGPTGDPSAQGWYEHDDGDYVLTEDTSVFEYNAVSDPTGNPSEQGWYELDDDEYVLTEDTTVVSGKTYYEQSVKTYYVKETYGTVIASGEGSLGSAQIDAERLATFAINGTVKFTVEASTGSGFVASEEHSVAIIEKPTVMATMTSPVTAQSPSISITSTSVCDLILIVTAQGGSSQFPEGLLMQTSGDTIYSDVVTPSWTFSNDVFTATLSLPNGLDFWNGCDYELSIVGADFTTSLKADEVVIPFSIDWSSEAEAPSATVMPVDNTDSDGIHHMAVDITLSAPTNSHETDVYDIYRMDGGKANLIGRDYPLTYQVRDEYAPFGDESLRYRIALRTADGDVSYSDFEYMLATEMMRFDWADGYLELPYGNTIADSYAKSVDFRSHMDGSMDGYWRQNIERKSTLSSNVIKIVQPNEVELARKLARYAGPVFVRLPNGCAFEADVQVTDLSVKNKAVTAVAIDATEVGLTREFMLPVPIVEES